MSHSQVISQCKVRYSHQNFLTSRWCYIEWFGRGETSRGVCIWIRIFFTIMQCAHFYDLVLSGRQLQHTCLFKEIGFGIVYCKHQNWRHPHKRSPVFQMSSMTPWCCCWRAQIRNTVEFTLIHQWTIWPAWLNYTELEDVNHCPLFGGAHHSLMHEGRLQLMDAVPSSSSQI